VAALVEDAVIWVKVPSAEERIARAKEQHADETMLYAMHY
jgi:hypothetical protein